MEEKFTSADGMKLWARVAKKKIVSEKTKNSFDNYEISDFSFADNISTRDLSGQYLEKLLKTNKLLIGGSADLSESTKTKTESSRNITSKDFSGNFIEYGVREHAMAAIMNGVAIAGLRPYGGTFLVFSDYMRPAIRLSALSKLPVIYVLTHDSIALGEDGPTHEPIEQLASLRLIPNLNIFRSCNAADVSYAWNTALSETTKPSCIILSRQKFEQIKTIDLEDVKKGGYIIKTPVDQRKKAKVTIIATGSEVPLAVEVAIKLKNAQVVSIPSVEKFREQSDKYKDEILQGYVVAIEAGATAGWFEFADAVMGIDEFGASGPGKNIYKNFGFDAEFIASEIIKKLK